jgi:pyruvate formate lyase activating enzyme
MDSLADTASPEAIARAAAENGCRSVAFTYNDPVIFLEYAMDVADACHALGVETVAVTAGYMHAEPRRDFYSKIDAANVDLKGFTEEFYFKQTGAHLAPVLETLRYLVHETRVWTELTTLLIPGHNDSDHEIGALCEWVARELGEGVPLHFTAFHPDYRMLDVPATPPSTLTRARQIGRAAGLRHVYTGNVHDVDGGTTRCSGCGEPVVVRDWYRILDYRIDDAGRCRACHTDVTGRFAAALGKPFGPRRLPVRLGA